MALLEMLMSLAVVIVLAWFAVDMYHSSPEVPESVAAWLAFKEVGTVVLALIGLCLLAFLVFEYQARLDLRRLEKERMKLEAEYVDCRFDILRLSNAWLVTSRTTGKTVDIVPR
jgi:hypothetical protein